MVPLNMESSHFGPDGTKNRWGHFLFAAFYLRKSSGSFAIFAAMRHASSRASVSIFVLVREGFTGGRVDEMPSAAREAIH
jgi:hypothetical protein